ncbi:MAG TPA: TorF family putative porin [Alphaproteobacteria bacterium]|jgi:uncharacterized protein (TIGR02001 family)
MIEKSGLWAAGVVAGAIVFSQVAFAEEAKGPTDIIPGSISATLTGASNYLYRGISQTDNIPAVQGSFDYALDIVDGFGVYAGVWASNVNFKDGGDAVIEVDTYFGIQGSLDAFTWKLGGIYYAYPGSESFRNYNFWEVNGGVGYDFGIAAITIGLNYSPDFYAGTGDAFYPAGDVTIPIPLLTDFSPYVSAHFGRQFIHDNALFGARDYNEWAIGIGATVEGLNLALKYQETDLSTSDCFAGRDWCGAHAVFTVSKTF